MMTQRPVSRDPLDLEIRTAAPARSTRRRHLLDLDDFTRADLEMYLATADAMKEILARPIKRVPALRGISVVNLFYEASTRTRVSFEIAAKNLSADVVNITATGSSVEKGESLLDTVATLEALGADIIVMRHSQSGAPYFLAERVRGHVINAGDGWHAHPTQALLDLYTLRCRLGDLTGRKVVIVGDILHSRVARSNLWALTLAGATVVLCGPPTLLPPTFAASWPGKVLIEHDFDRAIVDADVVMALRLQRERQQSGLLPSIREYVRLYQVTAERLRRARRDVVVMHPGPMNEGIEIAPDVAHGPHAVIEEQVTNGVAVRMATLFLLAGGEL